MSLISTGYEFHLPIPPYSLSLTPPLPLKFPAHTHAEPTREKELILNNQEKRKILYIRTLKRYT